MSFSKEEIRDAARANANALFDHYGVKVRRSSGQLEASWCPSCGHGSRRRILFHPVKLAWHCKSCGARGDLFDFIAEAERIRGDFDRVCTKGAEIWGVLPSTANADERERRRVEIRQRGEEIARRLAAEEQQLRLTEHPRALAYWERLQADHPDGIAYLASRGIDAHELAIVRYDARHENAPAVPLFASDGRIKNVIYRSPTEKPKGLYGCTTPGTMLDAVSNIRGDAPEVVITEGFADTLTAKVAWSGAVVLGAHGCENLENVAKVAAPMVAKRHGRLRIAPHRDAPGYMAARKALAIAEQSGLSVRRGSIELVVTGEQDLNDAWRAGWRPVG